MTVNGARTTQARHGACTAELDVLLRTLRMQLGAADTETKIILRSGPPPAGRP